MWILFLRWSTDPVQSYGSRHKSILSWFLVEIICGWMSFPRAAVHHWMAPGLPTIHLSVQFQSNYRLSSFSLLHSPSSMSRPHGGSDTFSLRGGGWRRRVGVGESYLCCSISFELHKPNTSGCYGVYSTVRVWGCSCASSPFWRVWQTEYSFKLYAWFSSLPCFPTLTYKAHLWVAAAQSIVASVVL